MPSEYTKHVGDSVGDGGYWTKYKGLIYSYKSFIINIVGDSGIEPPTSGM